MHSSLTVTDAICANPVSNAGDSSYTVGGVSSVPPEVSPEDGKRLQDVANVAAGCVPLLQDCRTKYSKWPLNSRFLLQVLMCWGWKRIIPGLQHVRRTCGAQK